MKRFLSLLCAIAFSAALTLPAFAEEQPHMREALAALKEAEKHLQEAQHDKGGHRAKAMTHVRAAMAQIEAGMKFDETHDSKGEKKKEMDKEMKH